MYHTEYKARHKKVLDIARKFARGRFSKKRFFQELESVDSPSDQIAFNDIEELRVFLLGQFDEYIKNNAILEKEAYALEISETILHEREHAERVINYGLTPVFHATKVSWGDFGGEMFNWIPSVSTKDFMYVAPTWTKRKILEYLAYVGKVTDPSREDKDIVSACVYT